MGLLTTTPSLSVSDKIAFANAIIAGVSALIALVAALVASRAVADQVRLARIDRRYTSFRAWIADPTHAALFAFEDSAIAMLEGCESDIARMTAARASHADILAYASDVTRKFKQAYDIPYYRAVGPSTRWDAEFGHQIVAAFEALEDDVIAGINDLCAGGTDRPLVERLRDRTCQIAEVIGRHDIDPPRPHFLRRLLHVHETHRHAHR